MLILERILGLASDPAIHEQLHSLEHEGSVETVTLDSADMQRHRLRVRGDRGTDYAIRLERHEQLRNGAVLMLDAHRAVVVQMQEQAWLPLLPPDSAAALAQGSSAGNMRWEAPSAGEASQVQLHGPEQDYLERLTPMLSDGRVRRSES